MIMRIFHINWEWTHNYKKMDHRLFCISTNYFIIIPIDIMNRLQFISQNINSTPTKHTYSKVLIQKNGKTAILWLNSPKQLNSLSPAMVKQIREAITELDHDDSVKIIVIRSKHDKVFCAGADIKHMKENDYSHPRNIEHFLIVQKALRSVRKPTVAVVQGKALGGGFQLALLTDIIIASKNASFALPEVTLGLIPGIGGTQILTRIVGAKVATRMILTGQPINAEEAQRLNIARLLPAQNFQTNLSAFLNNLTGKALDTLEAGKKAVRLAVETTLEQGLQHQMTIFQALFNKKGPKEGIAAFVQKRKPNFKDI